jgi:hypothetical protein
MELFRERLRFQFVGELPELVGIDARSEAEGMGDSLRRRMSPGCGGFAKAGADGAIDRVPEWNSKFPRPPLQ